ncbi:MAG TPA: lipase family protein [Blastocatellia bacterium]|nr:lipase family protein [Blastocatellia bacterium]
MDFDNSWEALLKPGEAGSYFEVHNGDPFRVDAPGYDGLNAWWLAELCRLVYRQGDDEVEHALSPVRNKILKRVGLEEQSFFNVDGTQCAIVKPRGSAGQPFKLLVFRGTDDLEAGLTDVNFILDDWSGPGQVHQGFRDAFEAVWKQVEQELDRVDGPAFYTGHSLGASLATLAAALKQPRALYTIGSPRTGDAVFRDSLAGARIYRIVNNRDVVTTVPPAIGFHHVGELHYIAHDGRVLVEPDDNTVAADRLKRDQTASHDLKHFFTDAPEPLADHAPVNYVAHLERAV